MNKYGILLDVCCRNPWPKISDAIRALLQAKIQHINAIIRRWWTCHTRECWFCPYDERNALGSFTLMRPLDLKSHELPFLKLTLYEINWSCTRYLCSKLFVLVCPDAVLMLLWTNPDWKSLTFGNHTESQCAWLGPCLVTQHDTAWCGSWERMEGKRAARVCLNNGTYCIMFTSFNIQSFICN